MAKTTKQSLRLNIYLDSPETRRKIKMKAAEEDLSISEYCRRVLIAHISGEEEVQSLRLKKMVGRARRFQSHTLGGKTFQVSSADLIREAREGR